MEEIIPKEKAGVCLACSDFPAPHTQTYVMYTFDAWINDRTQQAVRVPALAWFVNIVHSLALKVEGPMLHLMHVLAGGKTLLDTSRVPTNRSDMIWKEALRRGIPMEQILFFGVPMDIYRARLAGRWMYFESLPIPRQGGASPYQWTDDKHLFKDFLRRHDIPVANAAMVTNIREAPAAFAKLHKPLIVKPRLGSRARHTTTNIHTLEQLESAVRSAQVLCRYVMIEEHLLGTLCRATVVNGTLVGFLQKTPPRITGDGVHTIRELVAEKNLRKHPRVWSIELGYEHESYLGRLGYTLDSVPGRAATIDISRHSGRQVGGESREMPLSVHPALRAYVERAASALNISVVGFDLIIPDPEADPDAQKWGILEANTLPFIELHYQPLYGDSSNVAGALWDLWEKPTL